MITNTMKHTITLFTILLFAQLASLQAAEIKGLETSPGLTILGRYVAVDNVCAWPNLTLLPDGTIAAVIYGHPSHLNGPGDVQCWTSRDGIGQWQLSGTVAAHDAESTRGNVAAGLAHNGDLVVLVSGWTGPPGYRNHRLPPWVSRSSDGGRTWKVDKSAVALPKEISPDDKKRIPVPFGSIVKLTKDKLAATFYDTSGAVFALFSEDDGLLVEDRKGRLVLVLR